MGSGASFEPPKRDQHGRFVSDDKPSAATGLTPRVDIGRDDADGVLAGAVSENAVLIAAGLDSMEWEITNYRVSRWESGDVEKSATRWSAKRRTVPLVTQLDVDKLMSDVTAWGTPEPAQKLPTGGADTLVVCLADWQVGGTGPGGGSRETVTRVLALGPALIERTAHLRASGSPVPNLLVLGLGDLVEGCSGFYADQLFSVDLDNRSQLRTTYTLISALLRQWAPHFRRVDVAPIGGNHGEVRAGSGKDNVTGPADSKDVLAFEIVRDVLELAGGFEHVTWHIPEGELSRVLEVSGVRVGYTHGHLFRGGTGAPAKAERWWRGQVFGHQPVKDAHILVTGHYHHFASTEFSDAGRTWFQTPAMDNGSAWFTESSGSSAAPGTLTFRVGRTCGPRLWDDLRIL